MTKLDKYRKSIKRARRSQKRKDIQFSGCLMTPNTKALSEELRNNGEGEALMGLWTTIKGEAARIKRVLPYGGAERAEQVHSEIDRLVEKDLAEFKASKDSEGKEISCRKGCANCCYMHVSVTDDEAARLAEAVIEKGINIDRARLEQQAKIAEEDWMESPPELMRCPLLSPDNTCSVYDERPAACRTYFVVSPPEWCDMTDGVVRNVLAVHCRNAEIVSSAALNVELGKNVNNPASLPWRLLRELKRREPSFLGEYR